MLTEVCAFWEDVGGWWWCYMDFKEHWIEPSRKRLVGISLESTFNWLESDLEDSKLSASLPESVRLCCPLTSFCERCPKFGLWSRPPNTHSLCFHLFIHGFVRAFVVERSEVSLNTVDSCERDLFSYIAAAAGKFDKPELRRARRRPRPQP